MKPIAIVIPYFRAPEALRLNLECLSKQAGVSVNIFVRDNSEDNILFTRAVNEGLRRYCFSGEHDYVLVLNQDAYLRPGCLQELLSAMESAPTAGICAPISISEDEEVNWCGGADAYPWGRHLTVDINTLPEAPYESHWANGACVLLKVAMVREIGLMDENMRFICSDSDYSFTARSRGWKVLVAPRAFVQHSLSGSAAVANPSLNRIKLQDQLYFSEKWLNGDLYRKLAFEGNVLGSCRRAFKFDQVCALNFDQGLLPARHGLACG